MAARNAYFPLFIILNRWKIRGRPFDSEGGGAGKFCRDRLFIFITGWAGLFIFRYTKDRIFIFNYFNYNKNLTSKKHGGGAKCFPDFHML